MEINFSEIITLVNSLGFPIAAYIGLFWYIVKSDKQHKSEMDKMSEAINNNTNALIRLEGAVTGKGDNHA